MGDDVAIETSEGHDGSAAAGPPVPARIATGSQPVGVIVAPAPTGAADPLATGGDAARREAAPAADDPRLLRVGTVMSGVLAFACIAGALALCVFILRYANGRQPDLLALRLLMSCLACFIAMGFACLGFGLFLIRARGELRAEAARDAGAQPGGRGMLQSNAPGLIVIVCATVIMWLALRVQLARTHEETSGPAATGSYVGLEAPAPGAEPAPRDPAKEKVVMP